MHILLINPLPLNYEWPWPPLGLGYLASTLQREGFTVDILNISSHQASLALLDKKIK